MYIKSVKKRFKVFVAMLVLVTGIGVTSCTQKQPADLEPLISGIADKNIPDKRLSYWEVEVDHTGGESSLTGAVFCAKSHEELLTLAKEKSLVFNVDLLPDEAFEANPWGIVTLSVCNIRSSAKHSAELLTQAVLGTPVKVMRKTGSWYLVQTPDKYFGWVDEAAIALKSNDELAKWKLMPKVLYANLYGFAFAEPASSAKTVCDLVLTSLLNINGESGDFYSIVLPDERTAHVPKRDCRTLEIWKQKSLDADKILACANKFTGVPYLWGGTSAKMADCSGFTKSVYYNNGILLQRDASQQTLYGELIDTKSGYAGLAAGDLLFFGRKATGDQKERVTHVGLYTGDNKFIHASGKVRVNSLDKTSEIYTEYYESAFVRARRILDNVDNKGIEWVVDNKFYKEILPDE